MYTVTHYYQNPKRNYHTAWDTRTEACQEAFRYEHVVYVENTDDVDDWTKFDQGCIVVNHFKN